MLTGDIFLCTAAYYFAYVIRFEWFVAHTKETELFLRSVVWMVAVKILCLFLMRLYKGMWRYTSIHDLVNLVKAVAAASVLSYVIFLICYVDGFSRSVLILDTLLSLVLLGGFRLSVRLLIGRWGNNVLDGNGGQRIRLKRLLIIGAGSAGERLLREVRSNSRLRLSAIGFLDDDVAKLKLTVHGVPVLGKPDDMKSITQTYSIDEIAIAIPSASSAQMRRIVDACKTTGVPFRTIPGMEELIEGKVRVSALREVRYEDLLGRKPVEVDGNEIGKYLEGKSVMVTGAAGSIGSELCRQIAAFKPALLVLVDRNESGLYDIEMEFKTKYPGQAISAALGAVQNKSLMKRFMILNRVQVVFHAAAYKHVPMMELHPWEAVFNNVVGTKRLLDLCVESGVRKCVVISSDKAVKPTNVMGTTKRLTELLARAYAKQNRCKFMAVRFGNVIGSVGSVIPLFRKQIELGGPVTVTHKEITRYFMTIPEACRLVLQAGAIGRGGEIFVLQMGSPVRIDTLAREMITLSGLRPNEDIQIEYVGLRPGEKLYEELVAEGEEVMPTSHEKIMVLRSAADIDLQQLTSDISKLVQLAAECSAVGIKSQLQRMVAEYRPDLREGTCAATIFAATTDATTESSGRR